MAQSPCKSLSLAEIRRMADALKEKPLTFYFLLATPLRKSLRISAISARHKNHMRCDCGLPLSRLGIARTSSALRSLLHRFCET